MTLQITDKLLAEIHAHGESTYPEEGAGLMLGNMEFYGKQVIKLMVFDNAREDSARHNRFLLIPQDYMRGEQEAARLGLDVVGVFHSHPDHPNQPSEFDREWAMPVLSYVITSVRDGIAAGSRSWLLNEDRSAFMEEAIQVVENLPTTAG